MRIICIDRAAGNQAWVQVKTRNLNTVLYVKMIMQPHGTQCIVHEVDDPENQVKVSHAGIHRSVLAYIEHFAPALKREAYAAHMEWEC